MMRQREQGMVSLTISIVVGILLIIIVLSSFSIMFRLQRESTDSDLSIRAQYAAEAGAEDALTMIQRELAAGTLSAADFTNTCNDSGTQLSGTSYTCQKLSYTTNNLTGVLERDGQPVQFDLGSTPFSTIVVQWNTDEDSNANGVGTPSYAPPANFLGDSTNLGVDKWNYPAALELTTVAFPNGGNFNIATDTRYKFYTNLISPGNTATPTSSTAPTVANQTGDCTQAGSGGGYNCTMTFTGVGTPAGSNVLRLRSRYAGTHYSLKFYSAGGALMNVPDQFATIDVTARAGDVYRRIIYKVRLDTGTAAVDYVIYSDRDICKNFQVSLGTATGCPF